MIVLLDSENADRDLTTSVVVLTHTPSATEPIQCQALIYLGDGTKNLDSGTGDFEVRVEVGGQLVQPNPQIITCAGSLRVALMSAPFTVPPGEEVKIEVLSPDAADTDVDVTAHLYDVQPVDSSRVDADISSRSSHAANDVRDAILDDATRFSGGDIDEAISSRAATGEAAAAVATLNDIDVGDIMGVTVEGAFTLEEMLRISLAGLAGLVGGGGTDTITFTGIDGTTDRIIATVTTDGNRTNMVLDGS